MQTTSFLIPFNAPRSIAQRALLTVIAVSILIAFFPEMTTGIVAGASIVFLLIQGAAYGARILDRFLSREVNNRLERIALTDPLTLLPNRTHLVQRLATAIVEAKGGRIAVISIDLNGFKEINDIRGHEIGDKTLKAVGAHLQAATADHEFIGRTGGDGFTVFRRVDSIKDAERLAVRLRNRMLLPVTLDDGEEITIEGCVGIALYPQDDTIADCLISKSELAVYRAKTHTPDAVVFYEPTMDDAIRDRRKLIADLKSAMAENQFELHYQAQESLRTNDTVGHEALLRWRHPERGLVMPNDFIPITEETKLIVPIGEWVLRQACRDAAARPELGRVAVNLSPVQFSQPNLQAVIGQILFETGLDPKRLEIELTESTLMADTERNLAILEEIQKLGVSVAIDDFGTGYSSLSTLRSFHFDKIKLDRSFMSEVDSDPQAKAIIRAVLALGHSLDIPVLAEGVETRSQLEFLRKEGCSEAQGYLLGKPERLPAAMGKMAVLQAIAA